MLEVIREKVHGVFASVVLVFICVLFGLWGIQNYMGGGKEAPLVSVGGRDFFQNDVNKAYQQFAQNMAGMKLDEESLRKQAMGKLVKDEVLLQYVQKQDLTITDDTAKDFIKTLEYFQKDGKFDKGQYQTLLGSQGLSSDEFVLRIKKALLMDQFQRAVVDSSFATAPEVEAFFKIENEKRDVEFVILPLTPAADKPSEEQVSAYYQQHVDAFQSDEQVAVDYVELSLDALAARVNASEEQLKAFYDEQQALFSVKERRRISHILFAVGKEPNADQLALQKALAAREALKTKDFAKLAAEASDDKLTARNGGDLGLFESGVMEKGFEEAASKLKLGEVSEPVRSAYGYHLIKITELTPGEVKPFEAAHAEVVKAYQKAQAENAFSALAEKLSEVSYEHPDTLEPAAKVLGGEVMHSGWFTHAKGDGVAAEERVRSAAFSEDVLNGNNSEVLEINADRAVVLRMREHHAAAPKPLDEVRGQVIEAIQREQSLQRIADEANAIKRELLGGKPFTQVAGERHLALKKVAGVTRQISELPPEASQAVFKAAKPGVGQPSVIIINDPNAGKVVVNIVKAVDGAMSEAEKAKLAFIERNMGAAFGKAQFESLLNSLQAKADIRVHQAKQ